METSNVIFNLAKVIFGFAIPMVAIGLFLIVLVPLLFIFLSLYPSKKIFLEWAKSVVSFMTSILPHLLILGVALFLFSMFQYFLFPEEFTSSMKNIMNMTFIKAISYGTKHILSDDIIFAWIIGWWLLALAICYRLKESKEEKEEG